MCPQEGGTLMARQATGAIIEKTGKQGTTYAARFTAYGERRYETLGHSWLGYTRAQAITGLADILADVRRGMWTPFAGAAPPVPPEDPNFHSFASQWLADREPGLSARTVEDYVWALSHHLLPFFSEHRLSQITVSEVDRYKAAKLRERGLAARTLSNDSINKTSKRLAQILDVAVEYGYLPANPASSRRRRLKPSKPRRARLEAEQVAALLQAAGEHRALLATAILAGGLRVSELTALRWRDVNLAEHRLSVEKSKTDAGQRAVDLAPDLRDLLAAHKTSARFKGPDDYVFPTDRGTRRDRNNVRTRILYPAIERANGLLRSADRPLISPDMTFHSLRRTFASLLAENGADAAYTKAQTGHKSARLTLEVYTDVGNRQHGANEQLGKLLHGLETAPIPATHRQRLQASPPTGCANMLLCRAESLMGGDGLEPPTSCL
jgi:integrase